MSVDLGCPKWRALAAGLVVLGATAASAQAQTAQPLPGAPAGQASQPAQTGQQGRSLPSQSSIRPIGALPGITPPGERKLLHSFRLDVDQRFARSDSKAVGLPDERDIWETSLGLGFGVADRAFGRIGVSYGQQDITSKNSVDNGALDIGGEVSTTSFNFSGGYFMQPYLAVGAFYGRHSTSGAYQFPQPTPENATSGDGNSFGPFVRLTAPVFDGVTLGLTSSYIFSDGRQDYTNNVPAAQDGWSRMWLNSLDVDYRLTRRTRLLGGLAWSHVTDQRTMAFEPGLDRNWYIATAGIAHALTPALDLRLRASTWLANDKTDYDLISVGFSYGF